MTRGKMDGTFITEQKWRWSTFKHFVLVTNTQTLYVINNFRRNIFWIWLWSLYWTEGWTVHGIKCCSTEYKSNGKMYCYLAALRHIKALLPWTSQGFLIAGIHLTNSLVYYSNESTRLGIDGLVKNPEKYHIWPAVFKVMSVHVNNHKKKKKYLEKSEVMIYQNWRTR